MAAVSRRVERIRRVLKVAAAAWLAAGCTVVGPDYEAPDPSLPTAYNAPVPAIFEGQPPSDFWWSVFDDGVLDELVSQGIRANPDLQIASSRIREARALARAVEGATGPQLDFEGDVGAEWQQGDIGGDDNDDNDSSDGLSGEAGVGLAGVWEIDLFGRIFRTRQAAWAEAEREQALGREAVRLTVAEITRTYVERRAAQRRLELAQLSLELQQSTLQIVEHRVDAGLSPGLDAARTRGEVATLRAEIGPLRAEVAQLDNALAVLLGENPGSVDELLDNNGEIPTLSAGNAVGVPSNLLRRRPDIQAAELAIVAATAEVGVETADLYPSLTLPGTITLGIDDIGSGAATEVVASLSAMLSLPLFDGGQREAEVTAAEERVIQAVWSYRRTLLQAVDEVERALLGYVGARERLLAMEDAIANNRAAFEQSRVLYQGGFASFLEVFDSQRTLNASLQELAIAQRDVALQVIALYSALGTSLDLPES